MATPSDDPTNGTNNNGAPPPGGAGAAPGGGDAPQPGARPTTDDLPREVLKIRLEQEAERARGREREAIFAKYGVKNEDELAAKMQRLGALEETDKKRTAEEEERRKASMSNEERLKLENDQLKTKVQELQGQLDAANGKVAAMRQGQVVRQQAADLVDPDLLEEAELRFASHVKALRDAGDTAALLKFEKPGEVRAWFREFVTKKPKFAKTAAAAPGAAGAAGAGSAGGVQRPGATRKPITTGSSPARATPPGKVVAAPTNGKTLRPGKENSMSDKEAGEHLKKTFPGVRIPGLAS